MKIREEINEMDTKQKTATTKINKTMFGSLQRNVLQKTLSQANQQKETEDPN